MSAKQAILTVGTVTANLSLCYGAPSEGHVAVMAEPPLTAYGGAGGGQALAMAKLGYRSILATLVGDDANGENLLHHFAKAGVDIRFMLSVAGGKTAVVTTLKKEGEEAETLLYPAKTGKMPLHLIDEAFMTMPDGLCVRGELPFEVLLYSMKKAESKGIPIFLDANCFRRDFLPQELPKAEICSLSEEAVEQLTGIQVGGVDSSVKAALALSSMISAKYFVFHLGARGCFLFDGKMPYHISPYRLAAFDFSRAGDGFAAALVGAYLEGGGQIRSACEFANAAMALTAARGREADAFPTKEEVLLLQKK